MTCMSLQARGRQSLETSGAPADPSDAQTSGSARSMWIIGTMATADPFVDRWCEQVNVITCHVALLSIRWQMMYAVMCTTYGDDIRPIDRQNQGWKGLNR